MTPRRARHPEAAALDDGTVQLTYAEMIEDIEDSVAWLAARGVRRGDRVGIRMPSGSYALYVAILSTLAAGAAYVPVDADDPDERAELVFSEAAWSPSSPTTVWCAVPGSSRGGAPGLPWAATTPGSSSPPDRPAPRRVWRSATATPPHSSTPRRRCSCATTRSVPAIGCLRACPSPSMRPARRCGWRGAMALVWFPAPRALVRSGMDLGPWLVSRDITVVSTVPTLAALWPAEALEEVRLLIFGGEACPPDLAERLAVDGREVWNTYGPTEATVIACAARLSGRAGQHRPPASGLGSRRRRQGRNAGRARPGRRAGDRRRRPGPLSRSGEGRRKVRADAVAGLGPRLSQWRSGAPRTSRPVFPRARRRSGEGGRPAYRAREVDSALVNLPGVSGGAAAVRRSATGTPLLVGYIASADPDFDVAAARAQLTETLPAALVPRLVLVDELPTRTSGKVDRDALPWPPPGASEDEAPEWAAPWAGWPVSGATFSARRSTGRSRFLRPRGGSLSAAQLVTALRSRYPELTVAQLYDHPDLVRSRVSSTSWIRRRR